MTTEPLIPFIYEAALEPAGWESLFTRLSLEMGGAGVYLGQSRTDRFGAGDFWTIGVDPNAWSQFTENEQSEEGNRTLMALLRTEGRVVDRRSIILDADVRSDPLSRIFLAEQGLFHAAVSVVQRDCEFASTFWVARDRTHPIEGAAFERVRLLAPHIGQAMRIHLALRRSACEAETFVSVLENLDRGVALLDESLHIRYMNPAAERALDANDGLALRSGKLSAKQPRVQRALETLVRRLTASGGDMTGGALLVSGRSGLPTWRVTLAPAAGASLHSFAYRAKILAFIDDLARERNVPQPDALTVFFGLTPAEARVAALSARSLRPSEIAGVLGITLNTVKTHLKSIHGRLQVHTQAELVHLILTTCCD